MNNRLFYLNQLSAQYNSVFREYNENMRRYNQNVQDLINMFDLTDSPPVSPNHITIPALHHSESDEEILLSALFQNNSIHLNEDEISSGTRTYVYDDNNNTNAVNENQCPISLDFFQNGDELCSINGCGHTFKKITLMEWFRRSTSCPICRYNLSNRSNDREHNVIAFNALAQYFLNAMSNYPTSNSAVTESTDSTDDSDDEYVDNIPVD
jgi:hypothetical protein